MSLDIRSPHAKARGLVEVAKILALASTDGMRRGALTIAKEIGSQRAQDVFLRAKAAVPAGTTSDADYAGSLTYRELSDDLGASMLNAFVVDSIKPYAVQVGPNMASNVATQATIGSVTNEGAWKPVRSAHWAVSTPEMYKATVILVASDELMRSPHADRLFTAEARSGAGVAGDSRALTVLKNAAPTENATPGGAAAVLADIGARIADIPTTAQSVLLGYTSTTMIKRIATLPSASGNGEPAFPDFSATAGGVIAGVHILPSDASAVAYDNTTGSDIVIVDATQIVLVDLGFTVRTSREATLQLNDAPATDASMVAQSLFQTNLTAVLVERVLGISKMRANAAAVISGANYSAS